jgi:hypothetical protein
MQGRTTKEQKAATWQLFFVCIEQIVSLPGMHPYCRRCVAEDDFLNNAVPFSFYNELRTTP